nr:MAG TPA: hypothetical protein [Caudoviricetes sp.]
MLVLFLSDSFVSPNSQTGLHIKINSFIYHNDTIFSSLFQFFSF